MADTQPGPLERKVVSQLVACWNDRGTSNEHPPADCQYIVRELRNGDALLAEMAEALRVIIDDMLDEDAANAIARAALARYEEATSR